MKNLIFPEWKEATDTLYDLADTLGTYLFYDKSNGKWHLEFFDIKRLSDVPVEFRERFMNFYNIFRRTILKNDKENKLAKLLTRMYLIGEAEQRECGEEIVRYAGSICPDWTYAKIWFLMCLGVPMIIDITSAEEFDAYLEKIITAYLDKMAGEEDETESE